MELQKDAEGVSDCFSQLLIIIQSTCEKFIHELPINKKRRSKKTTKIKKRE